MRKLETVGWQVNDLGDLPIWRWSPDRNQRRQQNLDAVVSYATSSAAAIAEHAQDDDVVLVLGGDCTVGLGSLLAQPAPESIALVYFDMHSDLNVPDSTIDGALDWMGMAHALGNEKATPKLSRLGRRFPLLEPKQLVFLGFEPSQATSWELECIDRYRLETITAAEAIADPVAAADSALRQFEGHHGPLLVHFDVDVVDFIDAPLSENPEFLTA